MSILSGHIKNPRYPTINFTGNVLIDTCSTATYITEEAANKLNLKFTGHAWKYLNTLGHTVRKKFRKTQVLIENKRKQVILDRFVIEEITPPLDIKRWKQATEKFPQWSFTQFSQQLNEDYFPIDLLIGLDYANEIRLGEVIRCDGLEARMSILGPYIEGCISNKDQRHNEDNPYDHTLMTLSSSVPEDDLIDLIQQQDNVIQEQLDRAFNYDDYTLEQDRDKSQKELLDKFHAGITRVETKHGTLYQVQCCQERDIMVEHKLV